MPRAKRLALLGRLEADGAMPDARGGGVMGWVLFGVWVALAICAFMD